MLKSVTKTAIRPFQSEFIDKTILDELVNDEKNLVKRYFMSQTCKFDSNRKRQEDYIYRRGKPSTFFLIILEGSLILEAGMERTELVCKQFDHFGSKALLGINFFSRSFRFQEK